MPVTGGFSTRALMRVEERFSVARRPEDVFAT
jgi:hypothetical protein